MGKAFVQITISKLERRKENEFTQAKNEDLKKVLDLLVNAATWLKTKRTKQFVILYYLTDLDGNEEEVLHLNENGETYFGEKEGQPIFPLTLEKNQVERIWT
ncbi:hypothetical protein [Rossellomorea aquimaris]|jgi:hypothetical protein|uniref:hypothetical protein n=1 Tax=Rossellomorea aquimaris TaxID=189382 RepID=UPI002493E774|nr:hypothetical protein [Rossellomorea aquimaris]